MDLTKKFTGCSISGLLDVKKEKKREKEKEKTKNWEKAGFPESKG